MTSVTALADARHREAALKDPGTRAAARLPLAAVVVLAGSVRANHLRKSTGRNPLEMPVASHQTVMDCWQATVSGLAELAVSDRRPVPMRVMVDGGVHQPTEASRVGPLEVSIERDPSAFRGTGGLLHDLARSYPDPSFLLVLHGSQLPMEPLAGLLDERVDLGDDVTLVCQDDGTPSGVMLVRCGVLREISPVGYVDLNEQALPRIAEQASVRVLRTGQPVTRSIRTLAGYLEALRIYHRRESGRLIDSDPMSEDWQPTFQIAEGGAVIHESAVVHDSVVLSGARIDANAVVVRSVVGPGGVVPRGQSVVDSVVSA